MRIFNKEMLQNVPQWTVSSIKHFKEFWTLPFSGEGKLFPISHPSMAPHLGFLDQPVTGWGIILDAQIGDQINFTVLASTSDGGGDNFRCTKR